MVKLARPCLYSVNEAKQVGNLYHVTTLEAVATHIAPKDTLKGSGRYKNWLLKGSTDVVSFTRDKDFVVSTRVNRQAFVLFDFCVDGDKLSENHKIVPYNDLAYDQNTGKVDPYPLSPKSLEHEEVVQGSIHPFSNYVKDVRFCVSIYGLEEIEFIDKDLQSCKDYLTKFNIKSDIKLRSKFGSDRVVLDFPSFDAFVNTCSDITFLLNNVEIKDEEKIKDAFRYFTKEQIETLIEHEINAYTPDDDIINLLDIAITRFKLKKSDSVKRYKLTFDKLEKVIDKNIFRNRYIEERLEPTSQDSYMGYPLQDKVNLINKYGKFDSEQSYTIGNYAKTWFKNHPEDTKTSLHGSLSEKDFERDIDVEKMVDYLATNYDTKKVNSLLFDIIHLDGENIASKEFDDLKDADVYTLGISKTKGDTLYSLLTEWYDLFTKEELDELVKKTV